MAGIKLTPFVLFLILLIVLVISAIFGNYFSTEGFITYEFNKQPVDSVWIPVYTTDSTRDSVIKLYDNLFFDSKNGNLIEIDATPNGSITNFDNTGSTISNIYVTQRANPATTSMYASNISGGIITPQNTDDSMLTSIPDSFLSYIYPSQSKNTDSYSVFYLPWRDKTHLHIIDNSSVTVPSNNIATFMVGTDSDSIVEKKIYPANSAVGLTGYVDDSDPNNNKMTVNPLYDISRQLFQVSKNVFFDISNANLIINQGLANNQTIMVYDRNGVQTNPSTNKSNDIQNVSYTTYTVLDTNGQMLVLYSAIEKDTMLAVIRYKDATLKQFSLANVKRFSKSGLVNAPAPPTPPPTTCANTTPPSPPPMEQSGINDLVSLMMYWQTQGTPGSTYNKTQYSDDYLLKTQIIPPVCPACAACPGCAKPDMSNNTTMCTNCGGQGGSGTLTQNGTSVVPQTDSRTNIAGAVSNLGSSAGNVAETAIKTTGGLISSAGSEAKELVTDAAKGTTSLVTGAVKGATNLVTGAAKETEDLLKSAGTGIKDILTDNNGRNRTAGRSEMGRNQGRQQQGDYAGTLGTNYQQATDQYSYYGTLPAKGSANYMPVTADFSAFGR